MTDTNKCNLYDVLHDWFMQTDFSTEEGKEDTIRRLERDIQFMLRVYAPNTSEENVI